MGNSFKIPSVDTPALVIDEHRLDANIDRWAATADTRGVALRPHVKTHKSPVIAAKQRDAGAIGITVATLSEAKLFADNGFTDIFQAYPLWVSDHKMSTLRNLHENITFTVGIDSIDSAERLAAAVAGMKPLRVAIEIDSGQHRTGVSPDAVIQIAAAATKAGLNVAGVFTHGGHVYGTADAHRAAHDEQTALTAAANNLKTAGFDIQTISSGSTPTAQFDQPTITEQRPGVYVFGDSQQLHLGSATTDDIALFVVATVVSRKDNQYVLDVGSKTLGMDRPAWLNGYGTIVGHPEACIERLSEHHAVVITPGDIPHLGTTLAVIPNHVCNAVNLFDEYTICRDGEIVDYWPVAARGFNR